MRSSFFSRSLACLARWPAEYLRDVCFEVVDLLCLPLGLALEDLGLLVAELPVLRVVARVDLDPALVQLPDRG